MKKDKIIPNFNSIFSVFLFLGFGFLFFSRQGFSAELPECLSAKTKESQSFEPGCFAFSETQGIALCVVGSDSTEHTGSYHRSAKWRMISLPEGLVQEGCESWKEGKEAKEIDIDRFVLAGKRLSNLQKKIDEKGLRSITELAHSFTPRNTIDISYVPSGTSSEAATSLLVRKIRFIWNQKFLETRDVGCGFVNTYRDRISMMCTPAPKTAESISSTIDVFPNAKSVPFPSFTKKIQDTVYVNEEAGEGEAKMYVFGHYILMSIQKIQGEPGLSMGKYTSVLIDANRCRVISPIESKEE